MEMIEKADERKTAGSGKEELLACVPDDCLILTAYNKLNQSSKKTCARRGKNKQTIQSRRFGTNL